MIVIMCVVKYELACHVSYPEKEASIFLVLYDSHYLHRKIKESACHIDFLENEASIFLL